MFGEFLYEASDARVLLRELLQAFPFFPEAGEEEPKEVYTDGAYKRKEKKFFYASESVSHQKSQRENHFLACRDGCQKENKALVVAELIHQMLKVHVFGTMRLPRLTVKGCRGIVGA